MESAGAYVRQKRKPQRLRASCEPLGDADPFEGLLAGVAQRRELVTELLDLLGQREMQDWVAVAGDEALDSELREGGDEDDAEDENSIDNKTSSGGPSAKQPKPSSA
nr:EKC/KEOPS complex subunit GON7-like [Oryctolagus cuniculus]